jgi:hypothetical protein
MRPTQPRHSGWPVPLTKGSPKKPMRITAWLQPMPLLAVLLWGVWLAS